MHKTEIIKPNYAMKNPKMLILIKQKEKKKEIKEIVEIGYVIFEGHSNFHTEKNFFTEIQRNFLFFFPWCSWEEKHENVSEKRSKKETERACKISSDNFGVPPIVEDEFRVGVWNVDGDFAGLEWVRRNLNHTAWRSRRVFVLKMTCFPFTFR